MKILRRAAALAMLAAGAAAAEQTPVSPVLPEAKAVIGVLSPTGSPASGAAATVPVAAVRISDRLVVAFASNAVGDAVTIAPVVVASAPRAGSRTPSKAQAIAKRVSIAGTVAVTDKDSGLILVRVDAAALTAAGLPVVSMAKSALEFATPLRVVTPDGSSNSATLEPAHRLLVLPRDIVRITGTAGKAGGAVLNSCGELVGLVSTDKDDAAGAIPVSFVTKLLDSAKEDIDPVDSACKASDTDGLKQLAAAARADADSATQQMSAAEGELAKLGPSGSPAQVDAIKRRIKAARAAAESAKANADTLEDYRSDHKRDQLIVIGFALVTLLIVIAGATMLIGSSRRTLAREKDAANLASKADAAGRQLNARAWRDVVLSGASGVLKISGSKLADGLEGVIIGRSEANADVVFGPGDVSRKHARLFVRDGTLWIEDLESNRGTAVNGRRIAAGTPIEIANGDRVGIASHDFELRIL